MSRSSVCACYGRWAGGGRGNSNRSSLLGRCHKKESLVSEKSLVLSFLLLQIEAGSKYETFEYEACLLDNESQQHVYMNVNKYGGTEISKT